MSSPAGIINGTKFLLVRGVVPIGAIVSNSQAFNRALIEITNKDSNQHRELLSGDEGTKMIDSAVECLFSTNSAFLAMRDSYQTGSIDEYSVAINGIVSSNSFFAKVENFNETSGLNEATKATFSLKSSSTFGDL